VLGPVIPLDEADIKALNDRYTNVYGQPGRAETAKNGDS
jgi:hypothetical protein